MRARGQNQSLSFYLLKSQTGGQIIQQLIHIHLSHKSQMPANNTNNHTLFFPYLRRLVVCIVSPHHRPLPLRLGRCSLRKPLGVLKQVNFGANFKIFHKVVKKILVVFGFAVLGLKTLQRWRDRRRSTLASRACAQAKSRKCRQMNAKQ